MIKNHFKITGLTNNLDGSENELFTGFKRIKEEIIIGNDINEKNEVLDQLFDQVNYFIKKLDNEYN